MIQMLFVEVSLARGDYAQALELARAGEAKMRAAGYALLLPDLVQSQGRALFELGQIREAYLALLQARKIAKAQGSRRSLYSILTDLLLVSAALGDPLPESGEEPEDGKETLTTATFLAEAREALDLILTHISDPDRRASFLDRPGLRGILDG